MLKRSILVVLLLLTCLPTAQASCADDSSNRVLDAVLATRREWQLFQKPHAIPSGYTDFRTSTLRRGEEYVHVDVHCTVSAEAAEELLRSFRQVLQVDMCTRELNCGDEGYECPHWLAFRRGSVVVRLVSVTSHTHSVEGRTSSGDLRSTPLRVLGESNIELEAVAKLVDVALKAA
jgi:hypothetical protein